MTSSVDYHRYALRAGVILGLSPFTMCSVPFASLDACFLISCPLPYFLVYALVWVEHILQYFYEK